MTETIFCVLFFTNVKDVDLTYTAGSHQEARYWIRFHI